MKKHLLIEFRAGGGPKKFIEAVLSTDDTSAFEDFVRDGFSCTGRSDERFAGLRLTLAETTEAHLAARKEAGRKKGRESGKLALESLREKAD